MLRLQLPAHAEKQLASLAKHSGKSPDEYAKDTILAHLANNTRTLSQQTTPCLQAAFALWANHPDIADGLTYQQQLRDEW